MKLILLICIFSCFSSLAGETYVLAGKTKHNTYSDGTAETLISELTLNNCNIALSPVVDSADSRIAFSFSNRKYEADSINIKSNDDGSCTLVMAKGKAIK